MTALIRRLTAYALLRAGDVGGAADAGIGPMAAAPANFLPAFRLRRRETRDCVSWRNRSVGLTFIKMQPKRYLRNIVSVRGAPLLTAGLFFEQRLARSNGQAFWRPEHVPFDVSAGQRR